MSKPLTWEEQAVSLVELLGILRRRRGKTPRARISLTDWRRWRLNRGEGDSPPASEKGRGEGE